MSTESELEFQKNWRAEMQRRLDSGQDPMAALLEMNAIAAKKQKERRPPAPTKQETALPWPHVQCICGHEKAVYRIKEFGKRRLTPDLLARLRCSKCGKLGANRIVLSVPQSTLSERLSKAHGRLSIWITDFGYLLGRRTMTKSHRTAFWDGVFGFFALGILMFALLSLIFTP